MILQSPLLGPAEQQFWIQNLDKMTPEQQQQLAAILAKASDWQSDFEAIVLKAGREMERYVEENPAVIAAL